MAKPFPVGTTKPSKDSAESVEHSTATGHSLAHSWYGADDNNHLEAASFNPVPTRPTPTRDMIGPRRPRTSYILQPTCDVDGSVDISSTYPADSPRSTMWSALYDRVSQLWALSSLSTDISEDILRGVSIKIVLEGFARTFRESPILVDPQGGSQGEFMKSVPVKRLNDFISHDWASRRAGKFATLILVYNSGAALSISMCVGLVLAALQSTSVIGVLPYPRPEVIDHTIGGWGCWCQLVCPIAFVYVLIYWQAMRDKFGRPAKQVFLDKFCVDQVDPRRKAEGILGLAGFLNNTDRLVICWTPRYFTRLWCVYEIASWLYLRKPLDKIAFMPLALAKAIFAFHCTQVMAVLVYSIGQHVSGLSMAVGTMVVCILGPWYIQSCRHFVHDMRRLPGQLQEFSIATAECYCCAVDHKSPSTGKELQCDRQLVCRTVNEWFPEKDARMLHSSSASSNVEGIAGTVTSATNFDERVRGLFAPFILQRAGPTQIPYKYCVLIGIPYMWRLLDVMVSYGSWDVSLQVKLSKMLEYFVIAFCVLPITTKSSLWYCCFLDKAVGILRNPVLDWLLSMALFLPQGCLFTACFVSVSSALDTRNWLLYYGMCGFLVLVTIFFFLPARAWLSGRCAEDDDVVGH